MTSVSEVTIVAACEVTIVAACIIHGGKVLATERSYGHGAGFDETGWWEFPGGKVEPGEDPHQGLKREIHEELSATIEVGDPIVTIVHDYPEMRLNMTCFLCRLLSPIDLVEHLNARWLGPDELDTVRWLPADVGVLDAVRRTMREESTNLDKPGAVGAILAALGQREPGTLTHEEIEAIINDERNGWD